ncbi:vWA domain-containing protein [Neomegalonema sp.]|uniref:vWA domain-containing protein n=1 Tax=Neomegalonema sp. TaxID=2039713 RepID=UPI00262AEAA1|nr:vWA domain-containing protein [Neomegalonema sp.]MDD2867261.1 VWA domain-containing protein [Neomegalonema sp.]
MRGLAAVLLHFGWLMIAAVFAAPPVEARVVAVVFDDSGSMEDQTNFPAFGVQMLLSTLELEAGRDRLLLTRLNKGATPFSGDLGSALNIVRDEWGRQWEGSTPFKAIEATLRRIAEEKEENEEAFLIIFTDGVFDENEDFAATLARLPEYADKIRGGLRVDFIFMGDESHSIQNDPRRRTVGEILRSQGLRAGLLSTFNGRADDGAHQVRDGAELIATLRSIVARVGATDPEIMSPPFVRRDANALRLETPLAIRRIVSVSYGEKGAPLAQPEVSGMGGSATTEKFAFRMAGPDVENAPWRRLDMQGLTSRMVFDPPLPAGSYALPYDSSPDEGVFLLFQTAAELRLRLLDAQGVEVADEEGRALIARGEEVFVELALLSADAGGVLAPVENTPLLRDRLSYGLNVRTDQGAPRSLVVQPDPATGLGRVLLPTDAILAGELLATAEVRGFARTEAALRKFEIASFDAAVDLRLTPDSSCASCAPNERRLLLSGGESAVFAQGEVGVSAEVDSTTTLRLEDDLGGLLRIVGFTPLEGRPGGPSVGSFQLMVQGAPEELLQRKALSYRLLAETKRGGRTLGRSSLDGVLGFALSAASLLPQSPEPLKLDDLEALRLGAEAPILRLEGAFDSTSYARAFLDLHPEAFEISGGPRFVDWTLRREGENVLATPKIRAWCSCWLYLQGSKSIATIRWTGPAGFQTAEGRLAVDLRPPFFWGGALSCFYWLLGLLAGLYLLWALRCGLIAQRFPRGGGVDVIYNHDEPIFRPFPGLGWLPLQALLWPVYGAPHRVHSMEGVTMEAAPSGVRIRLYESDPSYVPANAGQKIEQLLQEAPKRLTYSLPWGGVVESRQGGRRRLQVLRRPEDRARR